MELPAGDSARCIAKVDASQEIAEAFVIGAKIIAGNRQLSQICHLLQVAEHPLHPVNTVASPFHIDVEFCQVDDRRKAHVEIKGIVGSDSEQGVSEEDRMEFGPGLSAGSKQGSLNLIDRVWSQHHIWLAVNYTVCADNMEIDKIPNFEGEVEEAKVVSLWKGCSDDLELSS